MDPGRWRQIDEIFQACLEVDVSRRPELLADACGSDASLRNSVEALLTLDTANVDLLDQPVLGLAAPFLADDLIQLISGQQVAHYEIIGLLGRGGMGEVYSARDQTLNRTVALKFLSAEFTRDPARLKRFQLEAQSASALNHPNILTIYQLGDFEGQQFIATEIVEGSTLRERMSTQQMTTAEIVDILTQIASALNAAHSAGIVHRDIKPENVMLRPDGYVKVLDFGLAKLVEQEDLVPAEKARPRSDISSGLFMGTVRYMSPEQGRGHAVDARSDIYSLGVVAYEMLAGKPPFTAKDTTTLVKAILADEPAPLTDVPPGLKQVVERCLRKERENRYRDAFELLNDLKAVRDKLDDDVRRERAIESGESTATSASGSTSVDTPLDVESLNAFRFLRPALAALALLIVGSVIAYIAYSSFLSPEENTDTEPNSTTAKNWTWKAPISFPRADAGAVALEGLIYVAGGWAVCTPHATLESYDPSTDLWTSRPPMITARGNHATAAYDGMLYAVGGATTCGGEIRAVEAYDPSKNAWIKRAPLPTPRTALMAATAGNKLYAIGGFTEGIGFLGLTTEYDSLTDKWIERSPMPTARSNAAIAVVDDVVYVIGGSGTAEAGTAVEAYDHRTDSWTTRASLPEPRTGHNSTVVDGVIYVLGGLPTPKKVYAYDPKVDAWTDAGELPAPRHTFGMTTIRDTIYLVGGFDGINYLSSVLAFVPGQISGIRSDQCPSGREWSRDARMPIGRSRAAVGEIDEKIYVAGGDRDYPNFSSANDAYDPTSGTWTTRAPMHTARSIRGTNNAVVDGILYVIGGNPIRTCSNITEAYDPKTDKWTTRAPMPTARCHLTVIAHKGLIYAIGGNTNISFTPVVEVYDPASDTWSTATPIPTPRQEAGAGVIEGIIYVAGGFGSEGPLATVEAYEPLTKVWTAKSPMLRSRNGVAAAVIDGKLVVLGGENSGTFLDIVEAYDPSVDRWTALEPLPQPRTGHSAIAVNDNLYIFGGDVNSPSGRIVTDEVWSWRRCNKD